jgi:secreted trypsin-like serine protease
MPVTAGAFSVLRLIIPLAFTSLASPALAIVGLGAETVAGTGPGRHIVMIISTRGNVCTGTAIAQNLVLTAAHCVAPPATYRVSTPEHRQGFATAGIAVHPRYDAAHYAAGRVTADVALVKVAQPLPASVIPVALAVTGNVVAGDRFTIAGFGTIAPRSDAGLGVARAAQLVATGRPGNIQVRLFDPATADKRLGMGACTGDSGGPAFRQIGGEYRLFGVVSWSTGPSGTTGCGGLTGITPLGLHEKWIAQVSRTLGR